MTTWFGSDHHFGHRNIIKYCKRPYSSVEEMNEDLIRRHNEVVRPEDTYICVGDLSLSWEAAEWATERMNGQKILVPGNHDKCWPHHTKAKSVRAAIKAEERYREMGWAVKDALCFHLGTDDVVYLVSHLPYQKDERHGERYAEYRPGDDGTPLICGHVHDLWHTQGRQYNVGVDVNNFTPVSFEAISEWRKTLSTNE